MLTQKQKSVKRLFDVVMAIIGLCILSWLIILLAIASTIDTKQNGIIRQIRIGFKGEKFYLYKIRTMKKGKKEKQSYGITQNQHRITKLGALLRKWKLDELPQLINVLQGTMSFVGPRPDLEGFADQLSGEEKIILSVKPGITGPASIYFRNEEKILTEKTDPDAYNKNVIWPKKVKLNKEYVKNYSFAKDITYIFQTIITIP